MKRVTKEVDFSITPTSFPSVVVPKDKEGFTQSFSVHQEKEYLEFWNKYGFVVIDDVLNKEEISSTINEVWNHVETFDWSEFKPQLKNNKVDRNDSRTWVDDFFPTSPEGFLGLEVTFDKQATINRQNENLYKVCKSLINNHKLWVSIDRYGIMRPTKNIAYGPLEKTTLRTSAIKSENPDLEVKDFPQWKTNSKWLHWDLNPWIWTHSDEGLPYFWDDDFIQENNGTGNTGEPKIQGLLNLVDNTEDDGGFLCVPGFNNIIKDYSAQTRDSEYAKKHSKEYVFVEVHPDDNMQNQHVKISFRGGSFLVWSSELPHCNFANDSNRFRIVQYVKMFSAQQKGKGAVARRATMKKMTKDIPTSELGRKMLGLEDW